MSTTRILIVDDDPDIREWMTVYLELEGFDVITASNGLEGLQTYEANHDQLQVVVTDLDMPAMTGTEMLEEIFKITPLMKIIVASGSLSPAETDGPSTISYLKKPYTPGELKTVLSSVLDYEAART